MNFRFHDPPRTAPARPGAAAGSTFVMVLWIAFGLVSLTLYFSHAMRLELRAADNRVCGIAADQAIEGAARYLAYMLSTTQTNGVMPDPSSYANNAVKVGNSYFWLIGRDTNSLPGESQLSFGLVDEASKLNLNTATSNMLVYLPRISLDLAVAILDWRDTNGGSGEFQTYYGMSAHPYQNKSAPFESVDELRLLYGGDLDTLEGRDLNRNGVLDPDERGDSLNAANDFGVLDYVTVFSREPNTYSNGTPRINIRTLSNNSQAFTALLQSTFTSSRAGDIINRLSMTTGGAGGRQPGGRAQPGGRPAATVLANFASPLQLYQTSGMTLEEFAQIANTLTTTNGSYIEGRVNINTASAAVLACLPGISDNPGLEQQLVTYRQTNPQNLTSVAWLVEALGQNNSSVLEALAATDLITTQSYQFTADVAAVGPHGRGYRRVRFVFDTSTGTPRIVYRQDLTHLGWALGKEIREALTKLDS